MAGDTACERTFTFQVSRPGLVVDVKADLRAGRATLQRTQLNMWGVMHVLHTFTGAPAADSRNRRDWWRNPVNLGYAAMLDRECVPVQRIKETTP